MKLYTSPGACSLADHIVLRWVDAAADIEVVDRVARKQPVFLALNPAGAVPVLVDDGWVLTQNAAILHYIAELHPQAGLAGDTPRERAEVNRWLAFLNADVHPAFHPLFGSTAFLEDAAVIDRTKDAARTKLRGLFERLDAQLDGRDWLTGSRSLADPYLFVVLRWARATGVDLDGLDRLQAFAVRMRSDPGVQAALQAEGLSD